MLIASNLTIQFTSNPLIDEATFMVNASDRIGLVGRNGSGKSTLLKVLKGELEPESGSLQFPKGYKIGFLKQDLIYADDRTVYEEAKTAFEEIKELQSVLDDLHLRIENLTDFSGKAYQQLIENVEQISQRLQHFELNKQDEKIERILLGLGFPREKFDNPVLSFSGGWQMRVELAKLLLSQPDLLLLDEPTNHLDIDSITWLEGFMQTYSGALILVSHDEVFMENVCNRILEISNAKLGDFQFGYQKFLAYKIERHEQQVAQAKNQDRVVKQMERNIERFRYKKNKAKFAQTLIRKLDKMEDVVIDEDEIQAMNLHFGDVPRSGRVVVECDGLSKRYGSNLVLDNIFLKIERGEKVAFVGKNGEGKSTLSRIINGTEDYEGELRPNHNVHIGYYAQDKADLLRGKETVFDYIDERATGDMRSRVRALLGAFLFSGDDIYKPVKVLSGGEKSRLSLASMMLNPTNLLILDEPTNHLDVISKKVLKKAIKDYTGTVIVVSHDRDFLSGLTEKVIEFKDKGVVEHLGDIYDYLEKRKMTRLDELNAGLSKQNQQKQSKSDSKSKLSYQQKKDLAKEERKYRKQISKFENKIKSLDEELEKLEKQLADPEIYSKSEQLQEMLAEHEMKKKAQEEAIDGWEKVETQLNFVLSQLAEDN